MMKAYPKYKDSGVPWLELVPEHWEVLRLGSQFVERKQKVSDKDFAPLSVTKKGILPQLDTAAKSNDGDNRKKVCSGDFVINSRSDRKGSSGVSPQTGSVSLINTVLTPISLDGRYVHNFFRSHSFQEEFYRVGRGIVADLWSTKYADMRTIMIPVPTEDEQQQISRYLDWQTSKINQYIKAKKKLIALLKEQKQNIINEAVTKGINPSVVMKDSGVEWLGEIPAHWEIRRLANVIFNIEQGWSPTAAEGKLAEGQWSVLSLSAIRAGNFNKQAIKPISTSVNVPLKLEVKNGDLLLTRANTRSKVGDCCIVENIRPRTIFSDLIYRLSTKDSIISKFIIQMLLSSIGRYQIEFSARGSSGTMPKISHSHIKNMRFPLPPINEQQSIVDYINQETALIDKTIDRTEREIELIQEYRTRLVSDVVTGKVDVRSVDIPEFEPVEADLEVQDGEESEDELITEGEE